MLVLSLAAVLAPAALAGGAIGGKVTAPEGVLLTDLRVILVPENPKNSRTAVKVSKKGEYFFGLAQDGRYTLAVAGTPLAVRAIKVLVYDSEARKNILDFEGPPPASSQVFDVKNSLKVTYDIVLGPTEPSAAAGEALPVSGGAPDPLLEVPALLQSGNFQDALARVDAALAHRPEDALLHYYRGFALFKAKQYELAQAEIARTLALNASQLGAHWVLGAILTAAGRKAEAAAEFQKEIDNPLADTPSRVSSYINMGLIQREMGKRDEAITAFERVLELDRTQSEAYSYLADLYLASGRLDKAAEVQSRCRALGLENANDTFNVGATYWNKKEFDKAEESFRRAVELDPKFALAWKHLGFALINLGKSAEASVALGKYLELLPDAPDAGDIRQTLAAIVKK